MMRRLTFAEAVFVAALPYRKSVYQTGGYSQTAGPACADQTFDWWNFLRTHYAARDLARAQAEAAAYCQVQSEQWRSPELGRLVGTDRVDFVSIWDDAYPPALRFSYDPPPILFYCGHPPANQSEGAARALAQDLGRHLLYSIGIAIVGTRNAHPLAVEAVRQYVATLVRADRSGSRVSGEAQGDANPTGTENTRDPSPTIVSGLALGIDRVAHLAAIENGLRGIAVLGAGLLHAGPRANLDVLRRAREAGTAFFLLSEFPPHTPARASHFPRRNRIIAGLVERVAVLQAPAKSGAMITARFALEEGRDVLAFDHALLRALPGSNDGARDLLESGAIPIRLPELEARLIQEPPYSAEHRAARLELWKQATLGNQVQWLGGRYYLRAG